MIGKPGQNVSASAAAHRAGTLRRGSLIATPSTCSKFATFTFFAPAATDRFDVVPIRRSRLRLSHCHRPRPRASSVALAGGACRCERAALDRRAMGGT
ncbi:protein of unknown function [Paraburkholderia kururiensis]